MSDSFAFETAIPCADCGTRRAGATVDGADLCGSCAWIRVEAASI